MGMLPVYYDDELPTCWATYLASPRWSLVLRCRKTRPGASFCVRLPGLVHCYFVEKRCDVAKSVMSQIGEGRGGDEEKAYTMHQE